MKERKDAPDTRDANKASDYPREGNSATSKMSHAETPPGSPEEPSKSDDRDSDDSAEWTPPPADVLKSPAAFATWLKSLPPPPKSYSVGQELNWGARWVEVILRIELPFWLLVSNTIIPVQFNGHAFSISVHGETFELHGQRITDSKKTVGYRGPLREKSELPETVQMILRENPDVGVLWRKCKTVLMIQTRCNEDVWNKACKPNKNVRPAVNRAVSLYLEELCRAHIPIVNKLIQIYRLATYDYFPFEVAPWDVPTWFVERDGHAVLCQLLPYREWDYHPMRLGPEGKIEISWFITPETLRDSFSALPTPGELELLDALNFIERGDYSGAVRRVTTAIEVVVEAVVEQSIIKIEGRAAAERFLNRTRTSLHQRVAKYEAISGRSFPFWKTLNETRDLRHKIVHTGYRLTSSDRGRASYAVDTGRWIFNWFENDNERQAIREGNIAIRSAGRDLAYGIFSATIEPDGVVLRPPTFKAN